ncbi:hypothetical protein, partial [Saccharopolyspora thermophila]
TTRFTNAEQDAIDEQQAAADQSSHDESTDSEDRLGPLSFVGVDISGDEVAFSPDNVVFMQKPGNSARPTVVSMWDENELEDDEHPRRVWEWADNIGRQLRVMRTLPGETWPEVLHWSQFRFRGEIDAPFEVPLVVAIYSVDDMLVLPVDRGNGVDSVLVSKETAAECISRIFRGYDSMFLLMPESERADFAVNLARALVTRRNNLVVYTGAGTTCVTADGRLAVLDNAGLVAVKSQPNRRNRSNPKAVTTWVETLRSTQVTAAPVYVLPGSAEGVGETVPSGSVDTPDVLQRIVEAAEVIEPDNMRKGSKAEVERHPAESKETYLTDGQRRIRLTPRVVRAWLAENGISYSRDGGIAQAVRIYINSPKHPGNAPEPREYRVDEAGRFFDTVRRLAAQHHLAEQRGLAIAINNLTDHVVAEYPPDQYTYVGIGRSPAPLIAALQARGHNAVSIPMSDFWAAPPQDSILHDTFAFFEINEPTLWQETVLEEHFDEFLGDLPADRDVLLLDYSVSGFSLISAQFFIQRYLDDRQSDLDSGDESDRKGTPAPAVHALAMCPLDQIYQVKSIRKRIHKNPRFDKDLRDLWEKRFRLLPLESNGPVGKYADLLADALVESAFDGLAQYGKYQVLQLVESSPRLKRGDQRPQDGYRMLQRLVEDVRLGPAGKAAALEGVAAQQERSATGYGGAFQAALGEPSSPAGSVPAGIVAAEWTGGLAGIGTTWEFGNGFGSVLGSSSVGSDVISAETFADDEGA